MHQPFSQRRAVKTGEVDSPRVQQEGPVWRIRSLEAARQVLRARNATKQAGFTAEKIPQGYLDHHPILVSDGPQHDEQRRKVARFFAPVVVERYVTQMEECADRLLDEATERGGCRLDDLALLYSVEITAEVVGLTESSVPKMARRLVSFFNQPPFDITRNDLGRTRRQWAQAAFNGLLPVARFYLFDVRPSLRRRRAEPQQDVISHLLEEGYSTTGVLVECVTYGTAGMVTTREFIVMAAWHLLEDEALRARYLAGEQGERLAILHEIIRLEPVVGHFYRRVTHPVPISDGGQEWTIQPGDLVDVCVRSANADPRAVGGEPLSLSPGRQLPAGVNAAVLSFGDGAHKCPGQPLAMLEAEVLISRLLERNPLIAADPELGWDNLIEGYWLRGLELALTSGRTDRLTG